MDINWFINKAQEPSTINGVFLLAGLAGVNISPELQTPIISILGGAAAIYNIIRKEK
jgi:hypothetical protein